MSGSKVNTELIFFIVYYNDTDKDMVPDNFEFKVIQLYLLAVTTSLSSYTR